MDEARTDPLLSRLSRLAGIATQRCSTLSTLGAALQSRIVEKTALEYLIYGNFKSDDVANDPGLPDQRWMSLDDVLDAVGKRSAETKLKAYVSELVQSRVTALEVERE